MRKRLKDFHSDVVDIMKLLKRGLFIDAYSELEDLDYRIGWAIKEERDSKC